MRSARKIASSTECVTSSVVMASSLQIRCSSRFRRRLVTASTDPNGSSSRRTSGPSASALAMATRWRIPPESCFGLDPANPSIPTSVRSAAT